MAKQGFEHLWAVPTSNKNIAFSYTGLHAFGLCFAKQATLWLVALLCYSTKEAKHQPREQTPRSGRLFVANK